MEIRKCHKSRHTAKRQYRRCRNTRKPGRDPKPKRASEFSLRPPSPCFILENKKKFFVFSIIFCVCRRSSTVVFHWTQTPKYHIER